MSRPRTRDLTASLALVVVLVLLNPATAFAGNSLRPTGLRVSVTNVDLATYMVDFDVTLNTTNWDTVFNAAPPTLGNLGDRFYSEFWVAVTTCVPPCTGTQISPTINAVEYGDGSVIPGITDLPMVAPNQYVGSFSHQYPGPGLYPLRVGASLNTFSASGSVSFTTGNPVITSTRVVFPAWIGITTTINYSPTPQVIGVTNTPGSNQPYPPTTGTGLNIPFTENVLEVPTASDAGLFGLALLLLGVGIVTLLRR